MAAKNAPWSREASKMLIDFYEQTPCLYVVASPDYYNRNKRNVALSNIAEAIQDIRPGTTIDEIKCKCNGLRTQFLKAESTRVQSKNNSGSGRDSVVEPSLWCYELLSFLKPHTIHCKGSSPTNSESNAGDEPNYFDIKFEHVADTSRGYEEEEEEKDGGEMEFNHERSTSSTSTASAKVTRLVKTRKRIRSKEDAPVTVVLVKEGRSAVQSFGCQPLPATENNLDIFGQLVAAELRSIKSASIVRKLKRKIISAIYDAQEEDEEEQSKM